MIYDALNIFLGICGVIGIADVLFFKGIIGVRLSEHLEDLIRYLRR